MKLQSMSRCLLLLTTVVVAGGGCVAEMESDGSDPSAEVAQEVGILAAPATPANFQVISEHCRGLNTVQWSASAGTTTYEVWWSPYSDFHSASIFTTTSATSKIINVGMSTIYLRVKACNADGCSGYSNQRTATYQSGCS